MSQFGLAEATCDANAVSGKIEHIKIDCLAHRYAEVKPAEVIDGIRIMATEDIATMKLNAITNRGSKKTLGTTENFSSISARAIC